MKQTTLLKGNECRHDGRGSKPDASIAASDTIPWHDDANRALMGSNMMRRAVPLLNLNLNCRNRPRNAGYKRQPDTLCGEGDGVVEYVDSNEIVIRYTRSDEENL